MTCVVKVVMFKLCLLLFINQILALLQKIETVEHINATIGENVLFSTNSISDMNRSLEWKYGCETSQKGIVTFPFRERDLKIFQSYKGRVDVFENGSFLLSNVQLNDTGCYTLTLVDTAGRELTVGKNLSVSEVEISDRHEYQNEVNMSKNIEMKNWKLIGTVIGVTVIGICAICAVVVYFIKRRKQESTGPVVPGVRSNENLNSNVPMVVYSTYTLKARKHIPGPAKMTHSQDWLNQLVTLLTGKRRFFELATGLFELRRLFKTEAERSKSLAWLSLSLVFSEATRPTEDT
ncbi:uncharacterized protein [Heterodontus francisci]|uniref:uncharacterized protein isoform X2 n=1 Tax=Heterodontus francisci TaxID=7792 RepID=UPI00355C40F4